MSWVQDGKKPDNINRKISFLDQDKPKLNVFSRLEYPKGSVLSRLEPSTSREQPSLNHDPPNKILKQVWVPKKNPILGKNPLVTKQSDLSPSLRASENQQSNANFDPIIACPSCFGIQEERKVATVDDNVEDDLLSSSTSSTADSDSMDL